MVGKVCNGLEVQGACLGGIFLYLGEFVTGLLKPEHGDINTCYTGLLKKIRLDNICKELRAMTAT